jgi:hypothetical protein
MTLQVRNEIYKCGSKWGRLMTAAALTDAAHCIYG